MNTHQFPEVVTRRADVHTTTKFVGCNELIILLRFAITVTRTPTAHVLGVNFLELCVSQQIALELC